MDTNPFKLLLGPTLSMETEAFLYLYWNGVTSSSNSAKALSRFMVKTISVNKKKTPPEHEFVLISVRDMHNPPEDRLFILERTTDEDEDKNKAVEEFLLHQDSKKILDAVLRSLLGIPPAVLAVGAAVVAGPAGLSVPAVASAILPLSVAEVSSSGSYHSRTDPIMEPSQNSMVDNATLMVTSAFRFLSELSVSRRGSNSLTGIKPRNDSCADDRWLAGVRIGSTAYGTSQGARSYKFNNLNLFHMALLAHVVHSEHPLYSLFEKNCYWFSNLIFLAAKSIDKILGSRPGPREIPDEKPEEIEDKFFLPFYLYMPQVAGRWMGFKVSEVQKIILNRVIRLFLMELGKYEEMVLLYSF
jgi:hypothetical protein